MINQLVNTVGIFRVDFRVNSRKKLQGRLFYNFFACVVSHDTVQFQSHTLIQTGPAKLFSFVCKGGAFLAAFCTKFDKISVVRVINYTDDGCLM